MRVTIAAALFVLWAEVGVILGTVLRSVGHWTLYRGRIVCGDFEGDFCDYHFVLFDSALHKKHVCSFQTPKVDHDHPDSMEFQNVGCGEIDAFRISGTWDSDGNINLCFTNTVYKLWAFYEYDRGEIEGGRVGPNKASPVYPVGMLEKRRDPKVEKESSWSIGGGAAPPKPCNWTVEWLNRCKLPSYCTFPASHQVVVIYGMLTP